MPLAPLPPDVAARVAALGATQVNLYRALAHAPDLLRAWMDFGWTLRDHDATPRRLRELMILRTAIVHGAEYEWSQHRRMAQTAGVTDEEVAALETWRDATVFGPAERAALALTDAILAGHVADEVNEEVDRHFTHAQRVELTLTAACYCMVPRVLDALRVPLEGAEPGARPGPS